MLFSRLASLLRGLLRAPDVIVDFVFEDGLLFVAVKNTGDGPARKVSVQFDPPLRGVGGTVDVSALALFQNIEFLAPHREIRAFLDVGEAYFRRAEPTRISVTIRFQDDDGTEHCRSITHDLSIYRDLGVRRRIPQTEATSRASHLQTTFPHPSQQIHEHV